LIVLNLLSFSIGFILGKLNSSSGVYYTDNNKHKINKQIPQSNISIDDKKIVTKIDTTNIEKKYDNLGDIQNSTENIGSSINKLKKLKGD
jgi:hypothetical protein